jgi:hypothetical protein
MFLDKLEECCTLVAAAGTEASAELADCADSSLAPADSSTLAGSAISHLMSIGAGPSSASAGDGLARPKGSGVRSGEPVPTIETQGTPSAAGAAPGAVVMFRSWVIVFGVQKSLIRNVKLQANGCMPCLVSACTLTRQTRQPVLRHCYCPRVLYRLSELETKTTRGLVRFRSRWSNRPGAAIIGSHRE